MLRQKDMEDNMLVAHRQFVSGLEKSLDLLSGRAREKQQKNRQKIKED